VREGCGSHSAEREIVNPISRWKNGLAFGNPTGVREGYCGVWKTDPRFQRFTGLGIFTSVLVNEAVPQMKEPKIVLDSFDYSCNDRKICHDVGPSNFRNWKYDFS